MKPYNYLASSGVSSTKETLEAKTIGPCCLSTGGGKGPTRTAIEEFLSKGMGKDGKTPASCGSC